MSKRFRSVRPRRLAIEGLEARDVPSATFQIATLTGANFATTSIDGITGGDRGGIAVSTTQVFVTGQSATGRYNLLNLTGGTSVGAQYDSLTGNVRTGQAYLLANKDFFTSVISPITQSQGNFGITVTHLIPIDGATGAQGAPILLTTSIFVGPGTGIYAGYDRIVLHPNNGFVYEIDLTTGFQGQVNTLSFGLTTPTHQPSLSWAFWGTTEHFANHDYLDYVADVTHIARTDVQTPGAPVNIATFSNLGNMASFTVSPANNRWYFHNQGTSQFQAAGGNIVGYADGTFQTGDLIVTTLTDNVTGSLRDMVTQANALGGVQTIGFQSGLNGPINLASPINVSDSVIIDGPGSGTITVSGTAANTLFTNSNSALISLHGLTLSNLNGLLVPYPLTAAGDVIATAGAQNVTFTNTLTVSTGLMTVNDGNAVDLGTTTTVNGSLTAANGFTIAAGKTLTGSGFVNGVVSDFGILAGSLTVTGNVDVPSGGTISPGGAGPANITINGNLVFAPGGTYTASLNGPGNNDRLTVNGTVDLGATGNSLSVFLGYAPNPGDAFLLIDNDQGEALTGTLNGVRNRSGLKYGSTFFQLRYDANSGNDLGLVANSAPVLNTNVDTNFVPILEDVPPNSNVGTTIDALVATGGLYSDAQGSFRSGLAFIALDNTNGAWQFSQNSGTNWTNFGAVLSTSATLLEADGSGKNRVRFQPTANYFGASSMSFKGWDTVDGKLDGTTGADTSASGGNNPYSTATETATIDVLAVDDPPAPVGDPYSVNEDATLTVPAAGVLVNDNDIDGPFPLTAALVSGPAHGTLTLNTDGSFTYQPVANFNGSDAFTYKAIDGDGEYGVAVVSLTVNPLNDNPTVVDDAIIIPEDGGPAPIDVLANDSNFPDTGETLTVTGVSTAAHGTVVITAGSKSVTYTSDKDYNGPDAFTYTIGDGNGGVATANMAVTVTSVNDPPVARNDVAGLLEDAGAQTIDVLFNDDSGPDTGETLLVHDVTQGLHGTVTIAMDKKSIFYSPNPNYAGPDQFLYTIDDGNGGTAAAAVAVDVANDHADRLEVVTTTPTDVFNEAVPGPAAAIVVDGGVQIGVGLEGVLSGAIVKFTSGFVAKKDTLTFAPFTTVAGTPIKGKFDKVKGILTLTGAGTTADYQSALRLVQYVNTSPAPVDGIRTLSIQVKDAAGIGDPGYKLIKVVGMNTPPTLSLPATLKAAKYKLGKAGVAVAGPLKIVDVDNMRLQSATVTITGGFQAADLLTAVTKKTGITATYNAGVLTLTGNATVKTYLKVLKSIKFSATAGPGVTRTISIQVDDGEALSHASNTVTHDVTVG